MSGNKKVKQTKKVEEKKNSVGRPPLWVNTEVVAKLIDEFFEREPKPTLAGLATSLGMSRKTLYNYSQKDEFLPIIKSARDKIIEVYEKLLIYSSKPTGVIFALKNMEWRDNQSIDHTSKGDKLEVSVVTYENVKTKSK